MEETLTQVTYVYKLVETPVTPEDPEEPIDPVTPEDPKDPIVEGKTTSYKTIDGRELYPTSKGILDKKDFTGYEFVEKIVDAKGNITYIYKLKETPVTPTDPTKPEDPEKPTDPVAPEKPVTKYVDKDGNVVAKQEDGKSPKKDVDGYEFVETKTDENGNTIHIYKKPESTTSEKDVDTSFVDKDGKAIVPKEEGAKDKKDLDGYKFVATKKDDKGNITHVYEKVATTPSTPSTPSTSTTSTSRTSSPVTTTSTSAKNTNPQTLVPGYAVYAFGIFGASALALFAEKQRRKNSGTLSGKEEEEEEKSSNK
nr:hypothetical protein [Peptoniphilus sp. KCTC 25270]